MVKRHTVFALIVAVALTTVTACGRDKKPAQGRELVNQLCSVSTSGVVYCADIAAIYKHVKAPAANAALQANFAVLYAKLDLDTNQHVLVDCGDNVWAAAPQQTAATPSRTDVHALLDACLDRLRPTMGGGSKLDPGAVLGGVNVTTPGRGATGGTGCATGSTQVAEEGHSESLWEKFSTWLIGVFAAEPVAGLGELATGRGAGIQPGIFEALKKKWITENVNSDDSTEQAKVQNMKYDEFIAYVKKQAGAPPRTQRPSPGGGESSCAEDAKQLLQFLEGCVRTGWQSYGCQKMMQCTDPAFTDPIPGSPEISCNNGNYVIYGGEQLIQRVVAAACESKVHVSPGSDSPCKIRQQGEAYKRVIDVCHSPIALIEECGVPKTATDELTNSLVKSVAQKIAAIRTDLCSKPGVPCPPPMDWIPTGPGR